MDSILKVCFFYEKYVHIILNQSQGLSGMTIKPFYLYFSFVLLFAFFFYLFVETKCIYVYCARDLMYVMYMILYNNIIHKAVQQKCVCSVDRITFQGVNNVVEKILK